VPITIELSSNPSFNGAQPNVHCCSIFHSIIMPLSSSAMLSKRIQTMPVTYCSWKIWDQLSVHQYRQTTHRPSSHEMVLQKFYARLTLLWQCSDGTKLWVKNVLSPQIPRKVHSCFIITFIVT
jgi:hypothetical protein